VSMPEQVKRPNPWRKMMMNNNNCCYYFYFYYLFIYLLQLGCYPVAVVILHVYKT